MAKHIGAIGLSGILASLAGHAAAQISVLPFETTLSSQYLIVATDETNDFQTDVASNNFELGANKAPVPANTDFLDNNGGPTLEGAVPDLPDNILPFDQGVGGHGNIAIISRFGEFELQDMGVYADPHIGIQVAAPNQSFNKSSNSFFNDPNMFPNTFDPMTETGMDVNPNDAVQTTRIDPTDNGGFNAGVTFGFDHSALKSELNTARDAINALMATETLNLASDSGEISSDFRFQASAGLNIVDIETGGNDFLINNANFVIDGPEGAFVIFRILGEDNMLISNGNVLAGTGGIGMNNVLFFAGDEDNDGSNFSFSNALLNGVAFWSLGNEGEINISNAQGSTQLIADVVDLDDVRFTRWAFAPTPSSAAIMALGLAFVTRRRRD